MGVRGFYTEPISAEFLRLLLRNCSLKLTREHKSRAHHKIGGCCPAPFLGSRAFVQHADTVAKQETPAGQLTDTQLLVEENDGLASNHERRTVFVAAGMAGSVVLCNSIHVRLWVLQMPRVAPTYHRCRVAH